MTSKDFYLMDLPPEESFFSNDKNMLILTVIFQKAIEKNVSIYNSEKIPLSFIEFYLNEIMQYKHLFKVETTEFFDQFEKNNPSINLMANMYVNSFYSNCTAIETLNEETFLIVDPKDIVNYIADITDNTDKGTMSIILNLCQITSHIDNSDELLPFNQLYENYMISKLIKSAEFNNYHGKSKMIVNIYDNDEKPQIKSAIKHAERLTSERINLAKQDGKVTKIVIPKLKLPSEYPKTLTFSRYDSKYRVKNFISATREILILNDLKINGVAYSNNFIEKRKAVNEENN